MTNNKKALGEHITGIDGLRALAVLSVIIYHFNSKFLPGGFTGVDVFFVISGYVISRSLSMREWSSFGELIKNFYSRRILRIAPALLFVLILASIFNTLFIPNSWLSSSNRLTALTAFFGVSNFYLVSGLDGYFSARILFNPFVHTWSLAVEEQFYLFFPFVFYSWLKAVKEGGRRRGLAAWGMPFFALASLLLSVYQSRYAHDYAFYLLPSRIWELAAGALLLQYQVSTQSNGGLANRTGLVSFVGLSMLVIGFWFADETLFPFPWALLPVAGTVLVIIAVTRKTENPSPILAFIESGILSYVGRISYSLYLWHWPVFSFFRWTVGMESLLNQILALLITLGMSAFSYHFIERKFRKNKFFTGQKGWRIVGGGAVVIGAAACSVAAMFLVSNKLQISLSQVNKDKFVWSNEYDMPSEPAGPQAMGHGRKIFLIGDSHAKAFKSMATYVAGNLGAEARIFGRSGCPIAVLITAASNDPSCKDFSRDALDWVKSQAKPGDIVFFASLRVQRFGDQWGLFDENMVLSRSKLPAQVEARRVALNEAIELADSLRAMGLTVMMNAPMPIFKAPPFRCADWYDRSNPICTPGFTVDRETLLSHREPAMEALRVLHDSHDVYVWDPFPILCNGPVCSAFDNDKPKFLDGDHLSGYGTRLLIPSFTDQLTEIWENRSDKKQAAQLPAPN